MIHSDVQEESATVLISLLYVFYWEVLSYMHMFF